MRRVAGTVWPRPGTHRRPIVNRLNEALNAALADAKSQARLTELGVAARPMTPAQFATFIGDETDKWAKVIKSAGIKPD